MTETYAELRERMAGMLDRYAVFWEVGDATFTPWPGDPDGGELRLVSALKAACEHPRTVPVVLERLAEVFEADEVRSVSFPELDAECGFAGCGSSDVVADRWVEMVSGYRMRACAAHWTALDSLHAGTSIS